ncbi:kinase-like protein [Rhizophagus irregularis]|uniref:Kinase-like protein n=1 Tax=Rhizophagus irregularis TaxID=588596 RepID=A0A2N0S7H0_9GLOM|nr:kinase-like protein [Rhizophagus irregularis]
MNSNEDWYQTAIKKFKINEILYKKFSGKPTRIGRGGFGLIYKTECNSIGTVAIKEITLGIEDDEICIKNFINELKIHSRTEHERILQFYGISRNIDEGLYYLVLEYANQGNLREFLIKKKSCDNCFEWEERVRLAVQIVEGLGYLHEVLNVAHRDLTNYVYRNLHSGNILLQEDDLNHKLEIYVSDLDSCIYSDYKMRKELYVYTSNIAPENLRGEIISIKSDIYNLGVIMRELTLGNYYNINNPQCYHELMQKCLDNDPENRPNTLDLLEELHIFTASPLRKRQFEDADSRGLQPLQISPPLQKNKRLINPSSEYFSNQFSRGADYSFF